MGKVVKSVAKVGKSVVKGAAKVVSSTVKGVSKVVKSVAKSVVSVGKKIVKGIGSAVKGIGKAIGKLGPIASIAMMAIPGMQAFAAGMWSSMGITGAIAQNMMTGAAMGFVTSGGDLKSALMGGAMAGIGSSLGGTFKAMGANPNMTFGEAFSSTISQQGVQSFSQGMSMAKAQWGNFTNSVSDFFSGAGNGSVEAGAERVATAAQNAPANATVGQMQQQITNTPVSEAWKATPESLAKADYAKMVQNYQAQGIDVQSSVADYQQFFSPQSTTSALSQSAETALGKAGIPEPQMGAKWTEGGVGSLPEYETFKRADLSQQLYKQGFTVEQVAEQASFGTTVAEQNQLLEQMLNDATGAQSVYSPSNYTEMLANRQQAVSTMKLPGTREKSLLERAAQTGKSIMDKWAQMPAMGEEDTGEQAMPWAGSTKGTPLVGLASAGAGMGGLLGYTDVMRQYQGTLISQAEAQAEAMRKRAQTGWGIA
jgi:hypothetical protein